MENGTNGSGKAKWTVMVYFAADNDLEEIAYQNLQTMKKVGSTNEVNIIAQLDTRLVGRTFRFWLGGAETTLDEDVIETLGEVNTGDPKELTNFVVWGMNAFPAEHYMLVLWGHGQGFEDRDHAGRVAARTVDKVVHQPEALATLATNYPGISSVSFRQHCPDQVSTTASELRGRVFVSKDKVEGDEIKSLSSADLGIALLKDNQDVLTIEELSSALSAALVQAKENGVEPANGKIDVLGLDLCMMGMAETAHHISDSVDLMIASEDTVPRDGWPYEQILSALVKFSRSVPEPLSVTPEQLSVMLVREYLLFYRDQQKDVTISACKLEKSPALVDALKELTNELVEKLPQPEMRAAVLVARALVQEFYMRDYVDLYDFCLHLGRACQDEKIRSCCVSVMNAIHQVREPEANPSKIEYSSENLVYTFGFSGHQLRDAQGISIYFPCLFLSPRYKELRFAQETGWNDFLNEFVQPFAEARAEMERAKPSESGLGLFSLPIKEDDSDPNDPCPAFSALFSGVKGVCGRPPRIPVMPENLVPRSPFAALNRRNSLASGTEQKKPGEHRDAETPRATSTGRRTPKSPTKD